MINPKSLANLKPPFPKGNKISPGRPKGSIDLNRRMEKALLADVQRGRNKGRQFMDVWIAAMQKRLLASKEPHWAKFVFDRLAPINEAVRTALGVQVNVSQQQAQVLTLAPPDISALDRMAELAKLFTAIPALPELPTNGKPLPGQISNVALHPLG